MFYYLVDFLLRTLDQSVQMLLHVACRSLGSSPLIVGPLFDGSRSAARNQMSKSAALDQRRLALADRILPTYHFDIPSDNIEFELHLSLCWIVQ